MLSILIPTYNYTCYRLVSDLHQQAELLGIPYEIILCEDGSKDKVSVIANHKIIELSHCRHVINADNIGQAATRNRLAQMAVYDWILFIDSDAAVESPDFLATYVNNIEKEDVVVGGLVHPACNFDPGKSLRFKYEKEADKTRGACFRQQNPYDKFSAFNCLMRRSVFLCILFDKTCSQYGYEDTLFGIELKKRSIRILHIDNPLVHTGIDANGDFLHKTETALHTLRALDGRLLGNSRIENTFSRFQRLHLTWMLKAAYALSGSLLRANLLSAHPSLTAFSLYKLFYYASLK